MITFVLAQVVLPEKNSHNSISDNISYLSPVYGVLISKDGYRFSEFIIRYVYYANIQKGIQF